MQRIDVVYVLIYDETRQSVLMVLNSDNKLWSLPGGTVESGETLVEAATREAYEEAGVTVEIGSLVSVNEAKVLRSDEHALFFTFQAHIVEGLPTIVRPDEIAAVEWVDVATANERLSYHPGGVQSLLEAHCPYIVEGVR